MVQFALKLVAIRLNLTARRSDDRCMNRDLPPGATVRPGSTTWRPGMRLLLALFCVLALATCGCGAKKIEVQSDGCYSGHVGGKFIDACGNQTYALKGDPKCGTFTLKDNGTYL